VHFAFSLCRSYSSIIAFLNRSTTLVIHDNGVVLDKLVHDRWALVTEFLVLART
jgi:hypothetical protein